MNIKTFSIHAVRNVFAFFIALGLGYVAYTVSPSSVEIPKAEAGIGDNVSGWIWSGGSGSGPSDPGEGPYTAGSNPGVGWISLNDTNEVAPYTDAPYGVRIDPMSGTGYFYGKGWSENVGWINFDQADTATCVTNYGGTRAQVNWATGDVSGWARAYNGSPTSGWDGCIRLSGMTSEATPQPYGVKISLTTGEFSGYAWGADVMGRIDFAPAGLASARIPVSSCPNGANNPPSCSQCPDGQFYNTVLVPPQCYPCSGGCSGSGGTIANPFGSLTCDNGATDVPGCNLCPPLQVISGGVCVSSLGNGNCDAGETLLTDPACKPKTRFWQF